MAILNTIDVPGGTTEQYDRVFELLGIGGESDLPDGLVIHICGADANGIHVFDVWESEEACARFLEERLSTALAGAGVENAIPTTEQLHAALPEGAGSEANVIMEIVVDAGTDVYDEMVAKMPSHVAGAATHPVVAHFAAVTPDGKLHIVDLWDSVEAFGAFAEAEIAPAAGDRLGEIAPSFIPVHNMARGRATVAA